ncbi:MFS transporter [Paenibacillus hodogayensis]|uniref:MFS transporter n=1 Tax=Paenibacillus hodogayensis TaxID=279208 RepID=A0ABV5W774_9BACL
MNSNSYVKLTKEKPLLLALAFALTISVMNATMFNVALPQISAEFGLSPSQASWMQTPYMIVFAIGSVTYGKLADKFKLKDLLTFGLIGFALGSLAGMAANEFWIVVLGRVLQATGASAITAASVIIPVRYFPRETRGRALGVTATGIALGTAIGPSVAGFITSAASWRLLFLLSLLALIALPLFRSCLDDAKGTAKPTDLWGGLLLGGTLAAWLGALTGGGPLLAVAGCVLFGLFGIRIRCTREPFIRPSLLFGNKRFAFSLLVAFASSCAFFSTPFLVPLLLGNVNGLAPRHIGLTMLPAAAMAAFLGRLGGKIADRRGSAALYGGAAALLASGFVLLSWAAGSSPALIAGVLVLANVGQTFMQIALSNTVSGTLPGDQTGVGMGLFSMVGFISGAVSTAALGRALDVGAHGVKLNPLHGGGPGLVYSDLFLALAVLVALAAILYALLAASGRKQTISKNRQHSPSYDKNTLD